VTDGQGKWVRESVGGHPCDVYECSNPNEYGYVVVYLHGNYLDPLCDHGPFVAQFERYGLRVVCPITKRSWWTDRICPDFDPNITAQEHVLKNVVPFIEDRFGCTPPKIGLLGISMGGQGALRFSYRYPAIFPVVAAISPAVDYHNRLAEGDDVLAEMYDDTESARQDTAILHIHPLNWPRHQFFCCDPTDNEWFDSADRLRMKLGSLGVQFECDLETVAGGHGFDYFNAMAVPAVDFIYQRLERERLRIV